MQTVVTVRTDFTMVQVRMMAIDLSMNIENAISAVKRNRTMRESERAMQLTDLENKARLMRDIVRSIEL